jgi:GNAT superfamily N-acetyltransferase
MTPATPGVIRRATPKEAPILNALTGRSAVSWGYEPELLDLEPEAITVTPEFIARSPVYVLESAGRVVGYYGLLGEPPETALDKLFVEPDRIGSGCGKRLGRHAAAPARAMRAEWVGEEPTSRPGWALQMFRFPIPAAAGGTDQG